MNGVPGSGGPHGNSFAVACPPRGRKETRDGPAFPWRDGEDCLSTVCSRSREQKGRVPQPSRSAEQRRGACRVATGRERRAIFFGYFLCSHKESTSPAGGETPANERPLGTQGSPTGLVTRDVRDALVASSPALAWIPAFAGMTKSVPGMSNVRAADLPPPQPSPASRGGSELQRRLGTARRSTEQRTTNNDTSTAAEAPSPRAAESAPSATSRRATSSSVVSDDDNAMTTTSTEKP
jgi:hypothetical protein